MTIPADQSDVVRRIDLSEHLRAGHQRLTLADASGNATGRQVTLAYHLPDDRGTGPGPSDPLTVKLGYDRTKLTVGEAATATAIITNNLPTPAPMVILDLRIPPGLTLNQEDLERVVACETIAKCQ